MIKVEEISKSFDGIEILKEISTVFDKGKTNLIIGQSGSGKTVLMKCLLGLLEVDRGNIYFDKFSDFISSSLIKRKINSIYLLPDVDERNFTDYINPNCLIKKKLDYKIIKFDIDINCKNLALK